MTDREEAMFEAFRRVYKASVRLRNNANGMVVAFEIPLREDIGHTNYRTLISYWTAYLKACDSIAEYDEARKALEEL